MKNKVGFPRLPCQHKAGFWRAQGNNVGLRKCRKAWEENNYYSVSLPGNNHCEHFGLYISNLFLCVFMICSMYMLLFVHKIRIIIYLLSCYLPIATIFHGCLKGIKGKKRACEYPEVVFEWRSCFFLIKIYLLFDCLWLPSYLKTLTYDINDTRVERGKVSSDTMPMGKCPIPVLWGIRDLPPPTLSLSLFL